MTIEIGSHSLIFFFFLSERWKTERKGWQDRWAGPSRLARCILTTCARSVVQPISTTIARLLLPPWPRRADSRPGMDFQTVAVVTVGRVTQLWRRMSRVCAPYLFASQPSLACSSLFRPRISFSKSLSWGPVHVQVFWSIDSFAIRGRLPRSEDWILRIDNW